MYSVLGNSKLYYISVWLDKLLYFIHFGIYHLQRWEADDGKARLIYSLTRKRFATARSQFKR